MEGYTASEVAGVVCWKIYCGKNNLKKPVRVQHNLKKYVGDGRSLRRVWWAGPGICSKLFKLETRRCSQKQSDNLVHYSRAQMGNR